LLHCDIQDKLVISLLRVRGFDFGLCGWRAFDL
jgi:hypothetical protein